MFGQDQQIVIVVVRLWRERRTNHNVAQTYWTADGETPHYTSCLTSPLGMLHYAKVNWRLQICV